MTKKQTKSKAKNLPKDQAKDENKENPVVTTHTNTTCVGDTYLSYNATYTLKDGSTVTSGGTMKPQGLEFMEQIVAMQKQINEAEPNEKISRHNYIAIELYNDRAIIHRQRVDEHNKECHPLEDIEINIENFSKGERGHKIMAEIGYQILQAWRDAGYNERGGTYSYLIIRELSEETKKMAIFLYNAVLENMHIERMQYDNAKYYKFRRRIIFTDPSEEEFVFSELIGASYVEIVGKDTIPRYGYILKENPQGVYQVEKVKEGFTGKHDKWYRRDRKQE